MVSRPFLGPALAVFAAVMLVLGWLEYFAPVSYDVFGVTLDPVKQEAIVSELAPGAGFGGLRRGDTVLLSQMTMSDRLRLRLGISPSGWILHLPIERGDKRLAVAVTSEWRPYPRAVVNNFLSFALVSTITLVILGIIAWRRPSIATAALVFFGAGTLTSGHLAALFTFLPNPVFGGVAIAVAALVSTLPLVALIPFMTRFPQLP